MAKLMEGLLATLAPRYSSGDVPQIPSMTGVLTREVAVISSGTGEWSGETWVFRVGAEAGVGGCLELRSDEGDIEPPDARVPPPGDIVPRIQRRGGDAPVPTADLEEPVRDDATDRHPDGVAVVRVHIDVQHVLRGVPSRWLRRRRGAVSGCHGDRPLLGEDRPCEDAPRRVNVEERVGRDRERRPTQVDRGGEGIDGIQDRGRPFGEQAVDHIGGWRRAHIESNAFFGDGGRNRVRTSRRDGVCAYEA